MKYYFKMFKSVLLICVSYTIVLALIFNVMYVHMRRKDIKDNEEYIFSKIVNDADRNILLAYDTLALIRRNTHVTQYINEKSPEYYNRLKVVGFLATIGTTYNVKHSIAITKASDNHVLTGRATYNISEFAESIGMSDGEFKIILEQLSAKKPGDLMYISTSIINDLSKEIKMLTVASYEKTGTSTPYYAFLTYHQDAFLGNVNNVSGEDRAVSMLSLGVPICVSGGLKINDMSEVVNAGNSKYIILEKQSQLGGVSYRLILDKRIHTHNFIIIFATSMLVIALLLLSGIWVAKKTTKKLYMPIKDMLGEMLDKNQDEFNYIENTIEVLKASHQKSLKNFDEYIASTRDRILKELIFGIVPDDKISNSIAELNVKIPKRTKFATAIIRFVNYEEIFVEFSNDVINVMVEYITTAFNTQFCNYDFYEIVRINNDSFVVVVCSNDLEMLKCDINTALINVEKSISADFIVAISHLFDELKQIAGAFSIARELIESNILSNKHIRILMVSELEYSADSNFYFPLEVEYRIISLVTKGNAEETHKTLNEIFERNFSERSLNKEQFLQFCYMIVAVINRILNSLNLTAEDVFGEGAIVFLELKMCIDPPSIRKKIFEVFDEIIKYVVHNSEIRNNIIGHKMVEFIHHNYQSDITLIDMADKFNLSRHYVSKLFKELTGNNFKEYLTQYRLNIAKDILLKKPDIKVKDLAVRVGCNTTDSLQRMFIKYEGLSPKQYVQKHNDSNL